MRIRFRNVRTKPQIEPEPHENSLEAPSQSILIKTKIEN